MTWTVGRRSRSADRADDGSEDATHVVSDLDPSTRLTTGRASADGRQGPARRVLDDDRPVAAARTATPGPRRPRPAAEARARPVASEPGPAPRSAPRRSPQTPRGGSGTRAGAAPARTDETPSAAPALPAAHRRGVPILLVLVAAAIGAGLLGWMGQTTDAGAFRGSWEFSRLGGPWLVAGFLGGAIGGWRRGAGGLVLGVVAGAVMVGAGSVAYYGLSYWGGGNDARRAATLGIGWGTAGLGVGAVVGLVGAAWTTALGRHPAPDGTRLVGSWVHGAALGTLGGLLMGESIALLWVWDGGSLHTMAILEGLGGVAVVALGAAARSWRFIVGAVLASAVAATLAPIATTALRESLRTIGWAGA